MCCEWLNSQAETDGLSFFRFPAKQERCELWENFVGCQDRKANDHTKVSSRYFVSCKGFVYQLSIMQMVTTGKPLIILIMCHLYLVEGQVSERQNNYTEVEQYERAKKCRIQHELPCTYE